MGISWPPLREHDMSFLDEKIEKSYLIDVT